MSARSEIVVVGGGYAGVLAANRLTTREDVNVTLVNPRESFVERVRLHQVVAGNHPGVVEFGDVLAERVRLVVDTVTRIDPGTSRVFLANGEPLAWDRLVYAVGSHGSEPGVPGAAAVAYPIATLEGAVPARIAVDALPATGAITVVGGGSTGIEVAAELGEQGRRVTLVCGGVLGPYLHPRGRTAIAARLAKLGVTVLDGAESMVTHVADNEVTLSGGRELPSDVTIWTAGFGVPDLARTSGLTTDVAGRLVTDETLTSVDDPRIVATGDAAAPSGLPLRMCCASATQLGLVAADTVLSRLAGSTPADLAVGFAGQCIALGRRNGLLQFARRDDTAVGLHVGGRPVAALKEAVSTAITRQLAKEARRPGSFRLPRVVRDPHRGAALRSAERPDRREADTVIR